MVCQIVNENQLNQFKVRITKPQSREKLKTLSKNIRNKLGIKSNQLFVDILYCLEISIPKIDPTFQFVISDVEQINKPNEAFFSPETNTIFIRADVYEKARNEDGRARFTIAHEIAHYFLFKILGIPHFEKWENIMYYNDATIHSMDPEWQADVVANYLLCKSNLIKNLSEKDISIYCKVSHNAAYTAQSNANGKKYFDYSEFFKKICSQSKST